MNTKIKRVINLIILIVLAIVTFLVVKSIPDFLGQEQTIEKVEMSETLELAPGTVFAVVSGENLINDGGYWRAIVPGISQLYCAEKGAHFRGGGIKYEELVNYVNSYNGRQSDGSCIAPIGTWSVPYYKISSSRKATPGEAFVLTWPDPDWDSWSKVKQYAIWETGSLSTNRKPPKETAEKVTADEIITYAEYYGTFQKDIDNNGKTMIKGNTTDAGNVKVSVAQGPQEYIAGPFKMDYVNGVFGVSFGGITDMYIVAESGNIKIKSFIINGQEITPVFFKEVDDKQLIAVGEQAYPKPNEEFYVKFNATSDEKIIKIHADFQWMEAEANITYYEGVKYAAVFSSSHSYHCHGHPGGYYDDYGDWIDTIDYCGDCCFTCTVSGKIEQIDPDFQNLLSATGKRTKKTGSLEIPVPDIPPVPKNLQIKLAGHVWEDEDSSKQSLPNGVKDGNEKWKAGVEVILHSGSGVVASTVTDSSGYYEFNALNAQRKYYIEFVYDGQIYQATQYNTGLSNEARLVGGVTNATENPSERNAFNNHFAQINSAPGNYKVRRSLYYGVGTTNKAYIVSKPSTETPYGIKEIYDYVISQATATKSYSAAYQNALNRYGNNDTVRSKLQFIEDCRISSYTGYNGGIVNYPIWDNFTESTVTRVIAGVTYYGLYPKHLNIDFGLNLRETFDFALRKDVEKATIEINGKTHTYTYDTRKVADETDHGTWDISVRLSDAYYNTKYSRELFGSDYQYKATDYGDNHEAYGKTKEDELNVYVTYKLTVRNQSQSVLGEVMEIVDYYDEDYEYVNERSYIQIKNGNNKGIHDIKVHSDSRYGKSNQTDLSGYDALYVRGLEGMKLTSGQTAYIYLTFKVKKDPDNTEYKNQWIRLDETVEKATPIGVGKENIAEINGFKTYYRDGTNIPNVGTVSGYDKAAGLFDKDSVPGNINPNDVPKDGNINYKNFEDDIDKAPNIRLILYRENGQLVARTIDGIVWEDERTVDSSEQKTSVADGIKQKGEKAINGVTVQLVELMDNGTEFIWKQFSSGQNKFNPNDVYSPIITTIGNPTSNDTISIPSVKDTTEGKYIFKSYMPGNYVVRFIYGDTVKTVLPNTGTAVTNAFGTQGQNAKSYNGQDYKSTTYQKDIVQNRQYVWREDSTWDKDKETLGKEITTVKTFDQVNFSNNEPTNALYGNNQKGYLYDITASDIKNNVSDAKDIKKDDNLNKAYSRQNKTLNSREDVIDYSDNDVMNHIAEVLASHEKLPLNKSEITSKLTELMSKTQMTAETGLINVELEYDRNATENQTVNNPTQYNITNVSLGLEERPKAQLSINKEVTNVKLTLADGSSLFDATQKATNVLWRKHKPYVFEYMNNTYKNKLVQDPMTKIRQQNTYDVKYGLIQLSMDEELMHGASIKVSYKITVTNVGEVDYKDNKFYYTGVTSNRNMDNVVTTRVNQVIDYVANNLQFYAIDNENWQVISQQDLLNGPVNETLRLKTAKYNTVITTNEKSNIPKAKLTPKMYNETASTVSDNLVLTQLITSENKTDDLTYRNIVEIVKTSNEVGRRNAYSVVGNQDPTVEPTEVDTDRAEIVKILPPYGNGGIYYIIGAITILSSAILITGIIFIKKKVLK